LCLRQTILLAENRFLQAGNGAENTKEKIQAVLYDRGEGFTAGAYIYIYIFSLFFVIWSGGICQIPSLYHGKKWKKIADVSKSIMWHNFLFPLFLVILGGYLSDTLCVSWKKVKRRAGV
jgi:hypothetical protein